LGDVVLEELHLELPEHIIDVVVLQLGLCDG